MVEDDVLGDAGLDKPIYMRPRPHRARSPSSRVSAPAPRPPARIPGGYYPFAAGADVTGSVPQDFFPRPPGVIGGSPFMSRPAGPIYAPPFPGYYAALPPDDLPEDNLSRALPDHLRRQVVMHRTREPAGTVIVDTANTTLYFVLGGGRAIRYGIGVGREGFTWSGRERISRMAEWPDWNPPAQMIERQPFLPRFMAGGPGNPLGARALYLGRTLYRIHGTNQPSTIGTFVSSGCIRMLNEDVEDLHSRVKVGTQVVVLPGRPPAQAAIR
jgi:lipoprotein-anchoring transpeptidase ErfK/SrfK